MCGFCSMAEAVIPCAVKGPGSLQADVTAEPAAEPDWASPGVTAFAIPDNTSTTETISVGGTRDETLEVAGDQDWFRIDLTDGDAIQIDLFGLDHDSGNGLGELIDPYVRIYDASGSFLAGNDDIDLGQILDSRLVFQASNTGTYFIEVDSYASNYTGDYRLAVAATTPPPPPPPSSPLDSIESGRALNTDDPVLVYFSEAGDTYNYNGTTYTATGVNAYEQAQLFSVFEGVEQFVDVDFQITTNRAQADLEWATDTLPNVDGGTLLGFFYFPSFSGNGGYGILNNNSGSFPRWNASPGGTLDTGGFMYGVAIHELGHGLGLAHPHDGGAGSEIMQGVTSSSDRGNFGLNQAPFTALSYNEGWNGNPAGFANSVAATGHGATFGALDIAALQNAYGTNTTHASGNDIYTLFDTQATGSGAGYYTTWDTGGTDQFRYSGSRDATIDLRAATLQYENGGGGFMSYVDGIIAGRTIANGVVIENATGGSGDDTLIGNDAGNLLVGNAGNDTLNGGEGNDTLDGGAGDDSLDAGDGNDTIIYTSGQDSIDGGAGSDWLDLRSLAQQVVGSLQTQTFSAASFSLQNIENLLLSDAGGMIEGSDGDNTIIAGIGNDTVSLLDGDDSIDAGGGDDYVVLGNGNDSADGGAGHDLLSIGGNSSPSYTVDLEAGTATASNGEVDRFTDFEVIGTGDADDTIFGSTGNDDVGGGAGDDIYFLNGGDDRAYGGSGADEIFGGAGNDTLLGDMGTDTINGGVGDDTLEGGIDDAAPPFDPDSQAAPVVDIFVFEFGDGFDTITDFQIGTDLIDFLGLGIGFADLAIVDVSGDARITYDFTTSGQITLDGISASSLTDASFLLDVDAPPPPPPPPPGLPQITGTSGNDNLAGTAAAEELIGLAGADVLNGRGGNDRMIGGTGDDRHYVDDAGDVVIELAGEGYDRTYGTISFALADNVEAGAARGGSDIDITGNGLANWITGNGGGNVLLGGAGADRLIAYAGSDTLNGGADHDILEGGTGADVFAFDAGTGTDLITDFEAGIDLIDVTSLGIAYADMTIVNSGARAIVLWDDPGGAGTRGIIVVDGVQADDLLLSSFITAFGDDQPAIIGTSGNDVLFGSQIGDEIRGLGGNDRLNGAGGADTLIGGAGDDRYDIDDLGDLIFEQAGEGHDIVYTEVDLTLSANVENARATGSSDIDLTGNEGINWLTGNSGANHLTGEGGNDRLQGRDGADTLDGGAGNDILEGGTGADVFAFDQGDGIDTVLDFEDGVDRLDFSSLGIGIADLRIADSGANVIVFYDESDPADRGLVVVSGHSASDLDGADFIFA